MQSEDFIPLSSSPAAEKDGDDGVDVCENNGKVKTKYFIQDETLQIYAVLKRPIDETDKETLEFVKSKRLKKKPSTNLSGAIISTLEIPTSHTQDFEKKYNLEDICATNFDLEDYNCMRSFSFGGFLPFKLNFLEFLYLKSCKESLLDRYFADNGREILKMRGDKLDEFSDLDSSCDSDYMMGENFERSKDAFMKKPIGNITNFVSNIRKYNDFLDKLNSHIKTSEQSQKLENLVCDAGKNVKLVDFWFTFFRNEINKFWKKKTHAPHNKTIVTEQEIVQIFDTVQHYIAKELLHKKFDDIKTNVQGQSILVDDVAELFTFIKQIFLRFTQDFDCDASCFRNLVDVFGIENFAKNKCFVKYDIGCKCDCVGECYSIECSYSTDITDQNGNIVIEKVYLLEPINEWYMLQVLFEERFITNFLSQKEKDELLQKPNYHYLKFCSNAQGDFGFLTLNDETHEDENDNINNKYLYFVQGKEDMSIMIKNSFFY